MRLVCSTLLPLALCALLSACGGGGGAGGSSGGGAGGSSGGGAGGGGVAASLYVGSEAQAALTPTNAARFVGVVFDSSALGDGFGAAAVTTSAKA